MDKRVVDCHEFFLVRYEDDSVDISCNRTEFDVVPITAYLEASVVARSMAEEINGTDEVFSLRAFENGVVSTQWRGEEGFISTWKEFQWVKKRMTESCHNGLANFPKAPDAILNVLWAVEYAFCKARKLLGDSSEELVPEVESKESDSNVVYQGNVVKLPLKKRT